MQRLSTCRWVDEHDNIIITGPTGIGRTWLACALVNKACREGYSAFYAWVSRLLYELAIARADDSLPKRLAKLAKVHIHILDDLGLSPLSEMERHDLLEVLEDRSGCRSTIVTSQLPTKKWHDTIGDPTVADAILDRVIHNAHRLELQGLSLRGLGETPEEQ